MCKYFHKEPDDEWFEKLPPIKKLWMYESWCQDHADKNEFAKSFSIFIGSFFNPEAAQQMLNEESSHSSSDEDFAESTKMVLEDRNRKENQPKRRRRRRQVVK